MATLLTKGLIVAGGLGGAIATGGTIYYLTSKEEKNASEKAPSTIAPKTTVKDKLISKLLKGKTLLTEKSDDDTNWTASLKLFETDHTSEPPKAPWVFANWKVTTSGTLNLASFKQECLRLNKEKVSGEKDPIYIAVEKYCTKEEQKVAGDV